MRKVHRDSIVRLAQSLGLQGILDAGRRLYGWRMSLRSHRSVFREAFLTNAWNDQHSRSGIGSSLEATASIRAALPDIMRRYEIASLLDAPCGDFHWMRAVDLSNVHYIGIDIVPEIIAHTAPYSSPTRTFQTANLIEDALPHADLILCRDAWVHFPHRYIFAALANFKRSGAAYLLTTSFKDRVNHDIAAMGYWQPIDLRAAPFNFPEPLLVIDERDPAYSDKHLALWRIRDLPSA
jgi:hypothetical protein